LKLCFLFLGMMASASYAYSEPQNVHERGERYSERIAGVSEKVVGHLESMDANEILSRSSQVEKIDTVARRIFGLDSPAAGSGALNLNVLTGGRAIVQINQNAWTLRT
jgi:hypothetical protein